VCAGHLLVIGTPADAKRLEIAQAVGADSTLGAQGENVVDWVKNFGDGYGLDLVIDPAGASASLKLALDIVRPAGQIAKVGWARNPSTIRSLAGTEGRHSPRELFA
jgi:L-iditol 2-dehydrogenase